MQQEPDIQIAIADDHTLFRKGLREIIANFPGFEVVCDVPNGKVLIDELGQSATLPDICVMDINMNVMNGYDTVRYLQQTWPDIKVLAVSMYDDEFSIIKMITNGAKGYIPKHSDPEELHRALISIHEKGLYHSDLVAHKLLQQFPMNPASTTHLVNDNEISFLSYLCSDLTIKEIAAMLNKSPRTLEKNCEVLLRKLNIKSRTGLAMFAMRIGIIPYDRQGE
jgi:DNA-binding NarL/FixJ family response regulator